MRAALAVLLVVCGIALSALDSLALEPDEFLLWKGYRLLESKGADREKLRSEFKVRWYFENNRPVQLGKSHDSARAVHQYELRTQYDLFTLGDRTVSAYFGPAFLTHEDAPDAARILAGLGFTMHDRLRIDFGYLSELNVGARHPKFGRTFWWVGAAYKFLEVKDVAVADVYGKYYTSANGSANIDNSITTHDPVRGEVGVRGYWRAGHFVLSAGPYMLLDGGVESVGVYSGIQCNVGRYLNAPSDSFVRGTSLAVESKFSPTEHGPSVRYGSALRSGSIRSRGLPPPPHHVAAFL